MSGFFSFSVGRKVLMAISGFFLLIFLLQHLLINILSVFSANSFNEASNFMKTNSLIQFVLQPVLFFGIIYHLVMGIYLDFKNRKARPIKYVKESAKENSSWVSRNMIVTGLMILLFIVIHMIDFFFPTIKAHYLTHEDLDTYLMVKTKFSNLSYLVIYIIAFIFLALHLMHGFESAFQSVGYNRKKYVGTVHIIGKIYAIVVPTLYAFIAVFHFINS